MKSEIKLKRSGADTAFTIYFTVMACLFTFTYIQLAAQIGIILYVLFSRFKISMNVVKNELFLLRWFGFLAFLALFSSQWAYSTKAGSNTVLTFFRMLAIGAVLFLYVNSYERAVAILKSYIISSVVMAAVVLVTTPLSQYGQADDGGFGVAIGQQRNGIGAVMAFCAFMSYILAQRGDFPFGKFYCVFSVFTVICTGSRGAMLQLVITVLVYVLLQNDLRKLVPYIFGIIIAVPIIIALVQAVPFLYETVWVRFENLFLTLSGSNVEADSSARGRELYKVLAGQMFRERPWLGYGVDGFYCMLRDVQYVDGVFLPPVYSHCNFTELASCFGIVGLAIWYIPVFQVLIGSFIQRKFSNEMKAIFAMLLSMIILDYARIPWMAHISMYYYFCIFLLYFYADKDKSKIFSTKIIIQ